MTPIVEQAGLPFAVVVPPDSDETWVDGDYLALIRSLGSSADGVLWAGQGVRA